MQIEAESEHHSAAPPPSPIPTGKGSRSAANDTFVKYLVKSSHVPELTLPEPRSYFPSTDLDQSPNTVDFKLLTSNDHDSIERLSTSARDFGAFLISGHGISLEEARSRSSLQEAEGFPAISSHQEAEFDREIPGGARIGREEILRGHFRESTIVWRTELAETEDYIRFSKYIEDIAYKLDRIIKEVVRVLSRARGDSQMLAEELEATLRIYRYVRGDQSELSKNLQKDHEANSAFFLRVLLPVESSSESTLRLETEGGPASFHLRVDPIPVVVTCGKQLEEWSHGELKSACSLEPDFPLGTSLLIEYECSLPRSPETQRRNDQRMFSLARQVLVVLIISFLLKFLADLWSWRV